MWSNNIFSESVTPRLQDCPTNPHNLTGPNSLVKLAVDQGRSSESDTVATDSNASYESVETSTVSTATNSWRNEPQSWRQPK